MPCSELGRWSAFWGCLSGLDRPPDWEVVQVRGSSPARNRNDIARKALALGAEWIFWLDDDLVFRPDTLTRLLQHDNVDIVCALSLRRHPPFEPLWFQSVDGPRITWVDDFRVEANGLTRIAGCTSGGMLTRTSVFRAIPEPWWTLGQFQPDEWNDDVWFCRAALSAGLEIWGDPNVRLGHLTNIEVWPHQVQKTGQWVTGLARSATPFVLMPMASQPVPSADPHADREPAMQRSE